MTRHPTPAPARQLRLWDDPAPAESTGRLVGTARRRQGWSQVRLAAATGMTQSSLSRLETGRRAASYDDVIAIAAVLELSPMVLIGETPTTIRRHSRAPSPTTMGASRHLAGRLVAAGLQGPFLGRGGSLRAVSAAIAGRQPLPAAQAVIALEVLAEHGR